MNKLDYEKVFKVLVDQTGHYMLDHHMQCMVLGISGGIDSTVVAAICHEVSKKTSIPLIGRSLPIKNKSDEFDVSKLVGEAFCDEFKVFNLNNSYKAALFDLCADAGLIDNCKGYDQYWLEDLEKMPDRTPIANGNLQARVRNHFVYDLAGLRKGITMSTDNQTEYQLGFWTRHGDEGDYDPIQELWKTEVYGLARWYQHNYARKCIEETENLRKRRVLVKVGLIEDDPIWKALEQSTALTPTDGLGISNSDLEQIGAKSYDEVDDILQTLIPICEWRPELGTIQIQLDKLYDKYGQDVVDKVWNRHLASEFKRKKAPIYIPREKYE